MMEIPNSILEKITKLYRSRYLGSEEIELLEAWIKDVETDPEVERWLSYNWDHSENKNIDLSFDEIRTRIESNRLKSSKQAIRVFILKIQKVAAFLLIPVLIFSIYLLIERSTESLPMTIVTAKGERTHIYLPDSSEVWMNVDSKLEYSMDYMATNRNIKLDGEAYFKVAKGKKFPFVVHANNFSVTAIGTEFNVSAYTSEKVASAILTEGIVELVYNVSTTKERSIRMVPGEKTTLDFAKHSIKVERTATEGELSWTNGILSFENDPMDEVFRKIERWYNVTIDFNPKEFQNETLTVNIRDGETIDRLFAIIDETLGINVKQTGNQYVVTRK